MHISFFRHFFIILICNCLWINLLRIFWIFVILLAILLPIKSPVASAVFWTALFEKVLSASVTDSQRALHVESTSILRRYVENQISTNYYVTSTYFFDLISLVEKSTLFPRIFFDVIWMVEKSTLFPSTFFDVISMVEKSTLFPRTFFDIISMVQKSTFFPRTFFGVISLIKKSTLFPRTYFSVISMVEKSTLLPLFRYNFSSRNIYLLFST